MCFFLEAPPGISVCRRQTECCEPGFGVRLYGGRAEGCMNCLVGARPLVWIAEPGDVGVASPKQKRYAMRTVFVLGRVDGKDVILQMHLRKERDYQHAL